MHYNVYYACRNIVSRGILGTQYLLIHNCILCPQNSQFFYQHCWVLTGLSLALTINVGSVYHSSEMNLADATRETLEFIDDTLRKKPQILLPIIAFAIASAAIRVSTTFLGLESRWLELIFIFPSFFVTLAVSVFSILAVSNFRKNGSPGAIKDLFIRTIRATPFLYLITLPLLYIVVLNSPLAIPALVLMAWFIFVPQVYLIDSVKNLPLLIANSREAARGKIELKRM